MWHVHSQVFVVGPPSASAVRLALSRSLALLRGPWPSVSSSSTFAFSLADRALVPRTLPCVLSFCPAWLLVFVFDVGRRWPLLRCPCRELSAPAVPSLWSLLSSVVAGCGGRALPPVPPLACRARSDAAAWRSRVRLAAALMKSTSVKMILGIMMSCLAAEGMGQKAKGWNRGES